MWRAFFLAIGISLCILGAECLVVESAVLASSLTSPRSPSPTDMLTPGGGSQAIETAEWMPWCFITLGVVVIIYTVSIPKRLQG